MGVRPRLDGALAEGRRGVGDDQFGVDLHPGAQTGAGRAGAVGRVEGERSGLELVDVDGVVVGARHLLAEPHLAVLVVLGEVDEVEHHQPAGERESGLDGVGEPALGGLLDREPVDDDLDGVLELLVQRRRLVQRVGLGVDADAREALGLELAEELDVLPLPTADDRSEHLEAAPLLQGQDAIDDLLRGLTLDLGAAGRAVRPARAGVEQTEVVVDLGDGAHRRARVARGGLLVDGDRRRQALDEVDVGLVHLAEELPGVGRQRLDVAALTLGEDRVEGQGRLAAAGETGEDDERVARQVDRDVLEVVLARAADDQLVGHREVSWDRCPAVRVGGARAPSGTRTRVRHRTSPAWSTPVGHHLTQRRQSSEHPGEGVHAPHAQCRMVR